MLILARHGRTTANAGGLLQGRADNPLDEVGIQQAERIGAVLRDRGALVVSSPLRRALSTAAAISDEVTVDPRLTELDYGTFDGQPHGDVPHEVWLRWRADPHFAPPQGESLAALGERVVAVLEELAPSAVDRDVVLVTHVSPIKAAVAWAVGSTVGVMSWRCRLDVASITRVAVTPTGPMLVSFNETAHLSVERV